MLLFAFWETRWWLINFCGLSEKIDGCFGTNEADRSVFLHWDRSGEYG